MLYSSHFLYVLTIWMYININVLCYELPFLKETCINSKIKDKYAPMSDIHSSEVAFQLFLSVVVVFIILLGQ